MAIAFRAISALASTGSASTTAISITPALPTGTLSGDRVYICTVGTTAVTTPTSWTAISSSSLGTGAVATDSGTRVVSAYYRDYDGVWTMPTVSQASGATPTLVGYAISYSKATTEGWFQNNPLASSTASDVTVTSTTYSASGASLSTTTGDLLLAIQGNPSNVTTTAGAITATGLTVGTVTERGDGGYSTNGFHGSIHIFDAFPTGTQTAASVQTSTVSVSGQSAGGTIFIRQTVIPKLSTFTDDFATVIDTTKWTAGTGSVTVSGGQGQFAASSTTANNIFSKLAADYDLTSEYVFCSVTTPSAVNSLHNFSFYVKDNLVFNSEVGWQFKSGTYGYYTYEDAGGTTTFTSLGAYTASTTYWLRIRNTSGGTGFTMETSSNNGNAWSSVGTPSTANWGTSGVLAARVFLTAYQTSATTSGTFQVDNLNIAGSANTPISISDTSNATTDAVTVSAAIPVTDTGSATSETLAVGVSLGGDTGATSETFTLSAGIPLSDTGTGADTVSLTAVIPLAEARPAASDAVTISAGIPLTDTGTGADTVGVTAAVPLADARPAGTDTVSVSAAVPLSDAGSGADSLTVTVSVPLSDLGNGSDALTVAAQVTVAETGSGADTISVSASIPLTETGSDSDALSVVTGGGSSAISLADTGSGTETVTLAATVSLTETGTGVDTLTVHVSVLLADLGTATDVLGVARPARDIKVRYGTVTIRRVGATGVRTRPVGASNLNVLELNTSGVGARHLGLGPASNRSNDLGDPTT